MCDCNGTGHGGLNCSILLESTTGFMTTGSVYSKTTPSTKGTETKITQSDQTGGEEIVAATSSSGSTSSSNNALWALFLLLLLIPCGVLCFIFLRRRRRRNTVFNSEDEAH